MKVLVTGGAGLIGRECVDQLLVAGHEVRVLDLRAGEMQPRALLELVSGNILDKVVRRECVSGIDGIVHLAAISRVQDAEEDPELARRTNFQGTSRVLEDAARATDPAPWCVHASSREVYGEPRRLPVAERALVKPVNQYGISKALAEGAVRSYSLQCKAPAVLLRFSNVYGSVHDHPRRVIPIFTTQALSGKALEVHDGSKTFDFVHVEDAGRAIVAAADWAVRRRGKREKAIVNVATGVGTSLGALASMVVESAGSRSKIAETKARDFDVHHFVGDPALAIKILGFRCEVKLEKGLARTVDAYRRLKPAALA